MAAWVALEKSVSTVEARTITWLMKAFLVCSAVRVVGNMVT